MLPFFNPFLLTTSVRGNQTKNSAKPLTASAWRKHTLNPASQPQLSKRSKQSTEDKENNCFILPNVVSPVIVKRQSDKIVDEIADGKLKSKKQRFTYEEIVRDQLDQLDGNQELADETIAKIASLLERAGKELLINETQKRKLFSTSPEVTRKFSTHLVKGPKPKKSAVSSTSKADLVKAICIELDKISDDDIVIKHIMSPEEKSKIDCALQLRLYEEVVVEGSSLELATIFEKAGCKINGRDADKLLVRLAAKKKVRQLSIHFVNKHLKINEVSRKLISQLSEICSEMTSAKSARKKIIPKMGTLHDLGAEGMDADKFREDMTVFFDELSEAVGEMDLLRDEMIEVGEELIDLYQTNGSNLEQDPLTEQLLHILDCLEKVMLPILKPAFEGPDGIESMATDIALHFDSRVQALKSALEACPLAQSAHKSDYMHWLVCHAKQQCLFMLQKLKRHISEFNCQTTEHFNKS